MSDVATLFLSAVGLGLAYNAAPGAVNTEAVRRGLARGPQPALHVELGALVGDLLWAALALTGTAFIVERRPLLAAFGIAGGCFLLRLAWRALAEAWRGGVSRAHGDAARGDFATGAVFSLANPFALAFWTGMGAGFSASGGGRGGFALLFAGFALGALLWCLTIPLLIGWGRRFVRPALFRWLNALCGVALGTFGLALLWRTVGALLEHALAGAVQAARTHALKAYVAPML